ncbi:hypothetical protein HDU67_005648 [Dinochytrium kinnereticum]|nr:hypothetical protein HDU67_005648 [Dinochytrium kinnereticum]
MTVSTTAQIKALNDKAVDLLLVTDPLYAPIFGIRGVLEDEIFQVSKSFQVDLVAKLNDLLAEVNAFGEEHSELVGNDAADLRFLRYALEGVLEQSGVPGEVGYALELGENHMGGNLMHLEMSFTMYQPAETPEDFQNYKTRLSKLPARFDDIIDNFRHGIARKVTLPIDSVELLIKKCVSSSGEGQEDLDEFALKSSMSKSEAAKKVVGDEKFMVASIKEFVLPSFAKMGKFLKEEYLPHAREFPGIFGLAGYKEAYETYIFQNTTVRYKADEIHALGLKEVERIAKLMEKAKTDCGFEGTLKEFQAAINDKEKFPQLFFDNEEGVLPYYMEIMEKAEEKMKEYFEKFPKFKCKIEGMPAYMEQQAPLAFYAPGTPEKYVLIFVFVRVRALIFLEQAGTFMANMRLHKIKPKHVAVAICLHEAMPGHHYQLSIAFENENQHVIRKFIMETAYAEGYGLYCEYLGEEMGFYSNPFDYFGRLECEMQRACRLVVDSGLHAQGWSIEKGVDFMAQYLSLPRDELLTEVRRYCVIPGQALSYKIGEIKMKELRKRAEGLLGDKFNVKEFHSVLVNDGSMPLEALDEAVMAWVNKQKTEA